MLVYIPLCVEGEVHSLSRSGEKKYVVSQARQHLFDEFPASFQLYTDYDRAQGRARNMVNNHLFKLSGDDLLRKEDNVTVRRGVFTVIYEATINPVMGVEIQEGNTYENLAQLQGKIERAHVEHLGEYLPTVTAQVAANVKHVFSPVLGGVAALIKPFYASTPEQPQPQSQQAQAVKPATNL